MGSPTITAFLPLLKDPTASQVRICDASSNITMSKSSLSGEINCATDRGLIKKQGHIFLVTFGALSIIVRIDSPLPLLVIAFVKNLSSAVSPESPCPEGRLWDSL